VFSFVTALSKVEGQKGESNVMKSFKAIVLLGTLLSAGTLIAQQDASQAPTPATPPAAQQHAPNPNRQAKHLAKELGLTRDQVAQIKPILAGRFQQMQSLRADTSLTPQDRRVKAHAIQQDSTEKIEAVLNDTQKQQYEQMLAQRRARRSQENAPATAPQG
jgi:periplasmic protein CpxP/Spy